ncbi:Hypothetical protein AJF4211_001920 [Avibacterium paragallinarum JF4211]|nr:Hypothetical protein AJF4211_001920 [Avibacterium paragallinarum JF4211]
MVFLSGKIYRFFYFISDYAFISIKSIFYYELFSLK